ncbi:transcription factor jumonji jmjc domain-containing protein [Caulobacter sp. Root487D2Y]|uniref:cupin-like domain-containing protein n=1 Tax=Caulobacter sp. Root487D2Y TaxID=1736547 RepID=UPI0006FC8B82|nr:cupin-like domain-containing protein [Caulobacter sp. Root487D2Y]KQY35933.1 transcription factor jumonji jmjc domain-containing protein [Caulobacter sp. Root487D2Y]
MDGGGVITGETLDIDALPRVAMVDRPSSADFDAIVRAERPVVIRGLLDAWPALAAGRRGPAALNVYLKAMDAGAPAPVMEAPAATGGRFGYGADLREFAFSKRQAGLGETLDRIERLLGDPAAPFVAIQMLPLATHLPAFVRDNPMPLVASKAMPRLWIGGAVRTQTHNDRDHNLACVIAGRRRFVLFPPTQVANLYVGPLDNPPPLSLVDPEAPDLARFPRYRDAYTAAQVAWLEPGDALFVPKYWWHHVTSLDPYNAMVNAWWGDTATGLERANDVFLTALLAFKDLPPGERAYWKAMFEAYVFAGDGEATTHIPDGLKGALGPMSPSFRAALKHQLKMAFLKGGA